MNSQFVTKAPFAKPSGIVNAGTTAPPAPHKLLPNGIELFDWVLTQTIAPMINSTESDLYVTFCPYIISSRRTFRSNLMHILLFYLF